MRVICRCDLRNPDMLETGRHSCSSNCIGLFSDADGRVSEELLILCSLDYSYQLQNFDVKPGTLTCVLQTRKYTHKQTKSPLYIKKYKMTKNAPEIERYTLCKAFCCSCHSTLSQTTWQRTAHKST